MRSLPPERAKRVKLLRATVNLLGSAGGGAGAGAGGTPPDASSGAAGEAGAVSSPFDPSQDGTKGVPPLGPPYEDEVPTIDLP